MQKKLAIALFIALSSHPQGAAGQAPVYKLLYSPPVGPIGFFDGIFEVQPGLFCILSTGVPAPSSIITVSSTGTFNLVYMFPPQGNSGFLVQPPNGRLYGSAYVGSTPSNSANFYYSLQVSGQGLRKSPLPPPWTVGIGPLVAPPDLLYDAIEQQSTMSPPLYAFVSVSETGVITILHQFASSDGFPISRMVLGPDGNTYNIGVESKSGATPVFIYRLTPTGTYSRIFTFPFNIPGQALSPLVAASDGNLYGTVAVGSNAEIYQLTLSGHYQVAAKFPTSIRTPLTLMQAADGNLYGTNALNQIFSYDFTTHAISLVYQMNTGGSQGACPCALVEGMDGKLYGAAPNGGNYPGSGAIFSLDIGLPKPLPMVSGLYPSSGPIGQKVVLWGNYLLGATSVKFNGVAATGAISTSVQSVVATVPAGATTGPVTITTANGSFTTIQSFTVQ